MGPQGDLEVKCNWVTQAGTTLKGCIVWRVEEEDNESEGNKIQATSGFLNKDSSNQENPIFYIAPRNKATASYAVTAVDILCSARNMEIFGAKEEYLDTSPGMRLHLENIPKNIDVYMLQYSFDEPVICCKVKLVSLQNKASLWIHSLHISVQRSAPVATPILPELSPKIDVSKVKAMLSEMGQDIPANANSLLSAMEAMQIAQKGQSEKLGAALGNMLSVLSLSSGTAANLPTSDGSIANASTSQNTATSQMPSSILSSFLAARNTQEFAQMMLKNEHIHDSPDDDKSSGDIYVSKPSAKTTKQDTLLIPTMTDGQLLNNDLKRHLENFVKQEMVQFEKRLIVNVEQLIKQSEQRITTKLDLILEKMTPKD